MGRDHQPPEDPTKPRLFFAVPIPEPTREVVAELAARVQAAVDGEGAHIRWVRMDGLHLTLRFLGPTPQDRLPELVELLEDEARRDTAFTVEIAGAGAFPGPARPRTLWLGLREGADELRAISERITDAVAAHAGEGLDTKPFAAHLTIARTDGVRAAPRAARILEELAADLDVRFQADRVVLYRSHLGHGPAWYEPIHEAPLRA
jgi:2'-5' RNA ligase